VDVDWHGRRHCIDGVWAGCFGVERHKIKGGRHQAATICPWTGDKYWTLGVQWQLQEIRVAVTDMEA
jgi:hypothetical protein